MRARLALALALLLAAGAASAGTVRKVRDTGPDANRMVICVVAEGYTAAEEPDFDAQAGAAIDAFLAAPPWSAYRGHVNAYTDFVASNESGADKPAPCYPSEVLRDTAFDATYCGLGTRRLLVVNEGRVLTEVASAVPQADLVGVLVNDTEYGGAGGSVLTFSTAPGATSELFLHEHGHTFARLADEYTTPNPGFPPGDWEPNVDVDSVAGRIDWDPWIEPGTPLPTTVPPAPPDTVGAFEGARYQTTGMFRPRHDCKMRSLAQGFCPVCAEAIVQALYTLVDPIDGESPDAGAVIAYDPCDAAGTLRFEVAPLLPADPAWIVATWEVGGMPIAGDGFALDLPIAILGGAPRSVVATVEDLTPLVRRRYWSPMLATRAWILDPIDRDGDGTGDACDCLPDDPSAGATPSREPDLRVRRPDVLSWDRVASSHDIARGRIRALHATGLLAGTCLDAGGSLLYSDGESAGGADGWWYLVRGRNACGVGPWGARSDATPRDVIACP